MASCGQMVEGSMVSFMCDLEANHTGPHRAVENQRSVRERAKWVAEQAHVGSGLGEFQGRAETTSERYTEGALDHPGTAMTLPPRETGDVAQIRPAVVVKYADQILAGEVHNPYDENCRKHAPVLGKDILLVERCYICRPDIPEIPIVAEGPEEEDPTSYVDLADLGKFDVSEPVPTKQRDGDQVLPSGTGEEYVQDRILAKTKILLDRGSMTAEEYSAIERTMLASKQVGIERYGTALQTFNGRDALQDLVEELRDAFVYGNQLLMAREADAERLVPVVQEAIRKTYLERVDAGITSTPDEHSLAFAQVAVEAILKGMGPVGGSR